MSLLILSFLAGVITVTAPCILPLLPVILGASVGRAGTDQADTWKRPVRITLGLAVSVVIFSLLLKASVALLGVPQIFWQIISGLLVIGFGFSLVMPLVWARIAARLGLEETATKLQVAANQKPGSSGDYLVGASLGPIFSSCSPTYALVIATVLPTSFLAGVGYIIAYALGLSLMLLLIALGGQKIVRRLGWLSNPKSHVRMVAGYILIAVGLLIILGLDKAFQASVLESGIYDPVLRFEQRLGL